MLIPLSIRLANPSEVMQNTEPLSAATGTSSPFGPMLLNMVPSQMRPCGSVRTSLERLRGSVSGRVNTVVPPVDRSSR